MGQKDPHDHLGLMAAINHGEDPWKKQTSTDEQDTETSDTTATKPSYV